MSSSSVLVRREELLAAGLFAVGISTGEDIDVWCRLACRGAFVFNAKLSATYNDVLSPGNKASSGAREVARPLFSQRLPKLLREGNKPSALVYSARSYANLHTFASIRLLLK